MKLKRLFRDTCVLVAFCGAFYLLTVFVSRLDGDGINDGSDFSVPRRKADYLWKKRDYPNAAVEYQKLTTADPFNGHAWNAYAMCYYNLRSDLISDITNLRLDQAKAFAEKQGLPVREVYNSSDYEVPDSQEVTGLKKRVKALNEKARPIFKKAAEFARYRGSASLYLAVIESYDGNNEEALDLLETYVGLGLFTSGEGLDKYPAFGVGGRETITGKKSSRTRLHSEPRFYEIVRQEFRNRRNSGSAAMSQRR
ncbi:MAG: hypothetical protein AB8B55_05070 [Mariniblastus sp.]